MGDVIDFHGRPDLPTTLSRSEARAAVQEIAKESGHILWTRHVQQRMQERDIADMQVLQVLRRGEVTTDPEWSPDRNWAVTMEADTAGELIRVGVALDVDKMGYLIIVLTAIVL